MTLPSIVPTGYAGTSADFNKAVADYSGAVRMVQGSVSVPSGTSANTIVGLVPFRKGARFTIGNSSIYAGNFGAASTTLSVGVVYNDSVNNTDNAALWASGSTAPQAGGFVSVAVKDGLTYVATDDGWLVAKILVADADATDSIYFNVGVAYSG